jgi:hypothetical protein
MKRVQCNCSCADVCPQGKTGMSTRCWINLKEEIKMTRDQAIEIEAKKLTL